MSYILDALRRADAERERDPARGIHAQPAAGAPVLSRARVPGWAWPAGGFLVLAAAGVVAWLRPASPEPPLVPAVAAVRPSPAAVVPVAAAAVMPPPPPALPEPARPAPGPIALKVPAAAPVAAKAPVAAASPPAPAASAATAERIYNVAELPPDVQGQLPKLAISGGVHSDNAAQRMLIVAGQVVNEGAELAPGVVLEQIRPRTAVLRFRGYRYSVGF
ncbi:general secretion pathway protein GspB [Ramlibacter sp. USB13]|uniref:General secretion pathway protein GspB n=1 Tax=Ramlibacter cellulosilyticus TaxID=2764187 RepID=A0A923SDH0_9BURK|nr:general secretion pathway protein GspB [Ramlibacter cellulosilyticus]MBC5785904.1 general secretion pathway protein GspB [Ramlibacter cellulosilyticus]